VNVINNRLVVLLGVDRLESSTTRY